MTQAKQDSDLFLTPKQAALWASEYLGKNVTSNNIIYLLNYGKIANHAQIIKQDFSQDSANDTPTSENLIHKDELKAYYDTLFTTKPHLNNPLSFAQCKEAETTKHIHRLHPYKGKFIPQLAEYFLDSHVDSIKREAVFKRSDIVLDPFCGSGTTLSVANELGMHAIGVDISIFNTILANVKVRDYDMGNLEYEILRLTKILESHIQQNQIVEFEQILNERLSEFNQAFFPNKEFKRKVVLGEIDEKSYGREKEQEFLEIYNDLVKKYNINIQIVNNEVSFFEKWYLDSIKCEIVYLRDEIAMSPKELRDILMIILSRTARSCRATTHSDLATLLTPITQTYYCRKHGRICKPLFSILKWWKSYSQDTLKRLKEFARLKTNTRQVCLNGDSININILAEVMKFDTQFGDLLETQKIAGIFSSPPYVGLIDYHEQHAYAYDIFTLPRNDKQEIGKMSEGQGKVAQEKYAQNIAKVLRNAKRFLKENYNIFLVANDKFNLYPKIAELAGMEIVNRYDRPVLNRSEKDKNKYNESIFHLKDKQGSS
ncbi:restriction endonuclease subunit M [Helicobacter monodelphidis]|uniref:DNA methyltransferase n=1 Tax=Helicobacter sp. 15-1451 TaxID=2004995 RepID=UPI000DCF3146|nr:DNA methyltransferase [Helicobacter sp. 15-1451]RAX57316.1 restriction endonuclease subunit M [Helicobacter sp. 15-1451]